MMDIDGFETSLQSAMEDARYMGERSSEGLHPVKPLQLPGEVAVGALIASEPASSFSFDSITSQPAGLFLFNRFVEQHEEPSAKPRMAFLEAVVEFQHTQGRQARAEKAAMVWNTYLRYSGAERLRLDAVCVSPQSRERAYRTKKRRKSVMYSHVGMIVRSTADVENRSVNSPTEATSAGSGVRLASSGRRASFAMEDSFSPVLSSSADASRRLEQRKSSSSRGASPAKPGSPVGQVKNRIDITGNFVIEVRAALVVEFKELCEQQSAKEQEIGSRGDDDDDDDDEEELKSAASQHAIVVTGLPDELFQTASDACVAALENLTVKFRESRAFQTYCGVLCLERSFAPDNDTFLELRLLGKGGFGMVAARKSVGTGKCYAVKMCNKHKIKAKGSADTCWNERASLSAVQSPFVVSLKYAFQSKINLMLVLDLLGGGDLSYHLEQETFKCFSVERSRLYAAEVTLGLAHLHAAGFIYRDLKPENVLLDDEGHCKISDLGLAVRADSLPKGYAGSLGYMAPEMLKRNAEGKFDHANGKYETYSHAVDWFSLGCMLYEMLSGFTPFRTPEAKDWAKEWHDREGESSKNETSKQAEIVADAFAKSKLHAAKRKFLRAKEKARSVMSATCSYDIKFNLKINKKKAFEKDARRLLKGLLKKKPSKRLGVEGVKNGLFFTRHLDFGEVLTKQVDPPFKPDPVAINALSKEDILGDDEDEEHDSEMTAEEQIEWSDWPYVNHTAFQEEIVEYLQWREENGYSDIDDSPKPDAKTSRSCSLL